MIIRTEAIVLRSMKYGETSRIVTLFTREKGKLTVIAKGARLSKSRFGATLLPMSYTQVVFYYKATRGLQTLSQSSHVQPLHAIGKDLEKIASGLRMMELVNALMQEEEQNPQVFNLLVQMLQTLDAAGSRAANVLLYFQIRLSVILGFAPDIDKQTVQQLPEAGGLLDLDTGAVLLPDETTTAGRHASRTALRAYAIIARAGLDAVMRMHMEPAVQGEVSQLIEDYLRYHVEDAYPTRSDNVLEQLRG